MTIKQNSHLTFKANATVARHGWLRLTPAYSYKLVQEALSSTSPEACILDPFAGTGTTGLVAAELGMSATLLDLNPFLIWFCNAKTRNYSAAIVDSAIHQAGIIADTAAKSVHEGDTAESPGIHRPDRWWTATTLNVLSHLKRELDSLEKGTPTYDLLAVAFCRTMIEVSNAAFNHQSMSFSSRTQLPLISDEHEAELVLRRYGDEVSRVCEAARLQLPGNAIAKLDDSRHMRSIGNESIDLIYTSPPYANRMSYIRELRPYMYWLGFLEDARDAGELDWKLVGGTWGIATSRVAAWESKTKLPLSAEFDATIQAIANCGQKNAALLSNYVHKYFTDMSQHFQQAFRVVRPGGTARFVVGNSTFYKILVPTEQWYAELLWSAGFENVNVTPLRKRNSKKELFEYEVAVSKPRSGYRSI